MQNRFGIKDFVFLVVLLATLGSVWLSMVQKTRMELAQQGVSAKLADIEQQVAQVNRKLELGAGVARGTTATSSAVNGVATDDTWARPGVKVEHWAAPHCAIDPSTIPGFGTGGEFTELFEAQPAKLTPYISSDVYSTRVLDRVCESLSSFDPKTLRLVGALADGWQIDPDGLWIRAHINPRARFSDGKPVTSEDIRWTYMDFINNPLIEAERTRSTQDNLKDVKVVDGLTVDFIFKEAFFTNILIALGDPILPKHYYSKFEPSQVNQGTGMTMGSGPFRLSKLPSGPEDLSNQWTPGEDVVLVRNEQYWAEKPALERMRFKSIKDDLGRLVAYRNGEGSMMLPTSPQFNKVLKEERDFEKSNYALKWTNMRCGYSFIAWQCGPRSGKNLTPFADKRVRRAMTMLLDRERMIRDIWDGIGIVSKGPNNPESPASDPAVKALPFDQDKAKQLLAEAGWKDRDGDGILENEKGDKFTFEYTYATGGEISERLARFVKDSYGKAGIIVTTRPVDWSRYQELLKLRDFDAITMGWGANAPESDPRQIFHSESIKEGGDNFTQWVNKDCDALIEKGRRTMDEATRMEVWRQFEACVAEDQPYTFVRVAPWLRFVKRDFGNVNTYKSGLEPQEFFRVSGSAQPTPSAN
ncbi:MAG: ABC transporter substrate-binding protein [Planctomycetota bacterium]